MEKQYFVFKIINVKSTKKINFFLKWHAQSSLKKTTLKSQKVIYKIYLKYLFQNVFVYLYSEQKKTTSNKEKHKEHIL